MHVAATPALPAVNPGHWTEEMRADALSVADLSDSSLKVNALTMKDLRISSSS